MMEVFLRIHRKPSLNSQKCFSALINLIENFSNVSPSLCVNIRVTQKDNLNTVNKYEKKNVLRI